MMGLNQYGMILSWSMMEYEEYDDGKILFLRRFWWEYVGCGPLPVTVANEGL